MAVDHIPELPRRRAWSAAGAIAMASAVVILAASGLGGPSVERASAQESPSSASPRPGDPSNIPPIVGRRPGTAVTLVRPDLGRREARRPRRGDQGQGGRSGRGRDGPGHPGGTRRGPVAAQPGGGAEEAHGRGVDRPTRRGQKGGRAHDPAPRRGEAALQHVRRHLEGQGSLRRRHGALPGGDAGHQGRAGPAPAGRDAPVARVGEGRRPRRPGRHRRIPRRRPSRPRSTWPWPVCATPRSGRPPPAAC